MEYLHAPDDGTLAKNLLSDRPDLDKEYVKKLADKGWYIKRLTNLIGIDMKCFVNAQVNIQPRLDFDVAEFVTNSYSLCKEKDIKQDFSPCFLFL